MKQQRKTKIICTIGPATSSADMIEKLIKAGMDVARLNFSHGSYSAHKKVIDTIRSAGEKLGKQIGILQDLSGPKIRLGELSKPSVLMKHGHTVILFAGNKSDNEEIPVNYEHLADDLNEGSRILLADGLVELSVDKIDDNGKLHCKVLNEGALSSHKGVNMPLTKLRVKAFTDKDKEDLEFGLKEEVDYVAMSFVRSVEDLVPIREILDARCENPPLLLAKMEKPEAVDKLGEILSFVDGIMVARGDLGVEMPLEQLPISQKRIISAARRAAKPVITATQMLRSMIDNPRPTRAEATDTANAVLDGTGAVMLSEETAVGSYPVEAVKFLDQIARATEEHIDSHRMLAEKDSESLPPIEASITRSACILAEKLNAACIVATTSSGVSARQVARFRPHIPIIGITNKEETLRKMPLFWGIIPMLVKGAEKPTELSDLAVKFALEKGLAKPGDRIIFTSGYPQLSAGSTDMLKVLTVPKE